MHRRYYRKKNNTVARTIAFIFSLVVAYALWTYLRPRFVTPETEQTASQSTQEVHQELSPEKDTLLDAPEATLTKQAMAQETLTTQASSENSSATLPTPAAKNAGEVTTNNAFNTASVDQESHAALSPLADQTKSPGTDDQTNLQQNTQTIAESTAPTKTVAKTENTNVTPATRTITVHNGIDKKMLGYKKFGTHYPTTFKITIADKPLESGESTNVEIQDNTLVARYDFEFMNGYRNGAKEVTFKLKPDTKILTLTFNWKEEPYHLSGEAEKIDSIIAKNVTYQA